MTAFQPMRSPDPNGGLLAMVDDVLAEVRAELERAYRKFPRLEVNAHEGYAVLAEEVDELWDEVKNNDPDRQRPEAIQVAAMAVRFVVDLFSVRTSSDATAGARPEEQRRQGGGGVGEATTPGLSVASAEASQRDVDGGSR